MYLNKIFNNRYIRIDTYKNSKPLYYIKSMFIYLTPSFFYQKNLDTLTTKSITKDIMDRVNYYNKLTNHFSLVEAKSISEFKKEKKKTYFFDLYRYLIYFNKELRIKYLFGDIIYIPEEPSIVKSRPIHGKNENSILMKLNTVRHFIFVNDKVKFEDKKNILIWRGKANQEHRKKFLEQFHNNPFCDVGQIINKINFPYYKEKMSLKEQLNYKFILSIEGTDVASNLKWIMSSNSLAFMVKPKYETWFMEGKLIPDYHYILLKDDYSNLNEKIKYYTEHINEAKQIIKNANNYVHQFKNKEQEDIISLLVLKKYFEQSKQLNI